MSKRPKTNFFSIHIVESTPGAPRRNLNAIPHNSNIREFFEMNCDVCKIELTSLQHAKLHYLEHGIPDGYIKCCDMKFKQIKDVNDHILYHIDPHIFR